MVVVVEHFCSYIFALGLLARAASLLDSSTAVAGYNLDDRKQVGGRVRVAVRRRREGERDEPGTIPGEYKANVPEVHTPSTRVDQHPTQGPLIAVHR